MYLGIDLGTSGVKVLLIDQSQAIVDSASASLSVSNPHHGWSEQDPLSWITATENAMSALAERNELAAVKGIGLSGQMHGATLLDAAGEIIRPCVLWNDVRSHAEAEQFNSNPLFEKVTGNVVFPGFTAPKIAWCAGHEKENFDRIAKVLLPKDYLRYWLTGEFVSEMSDASGTGWLDIGARKWSADLLAATGLSIDHMPSLVEGTAVSGQLRAELAGQFGMNSSVVVAGGAGDNAASACGLGSVKPGAAFASLGTSGVLFVSNESFKPNAASAVHAFCHALPERWHQMGVILSATDSLNWYARIAGTDAADLTAALGDTLRAPSHVTFLPYLSGERTPHNDAHIRGVLSGITTSTGRDDLTQAVLDGVSFAFRDNLSALAAAGTEVERVTAVGGGSQSRYWLASLATCLNIPVDVLNDGEFGAAFGAARLGLIAAENSDAEVVCQSAPAAFTVEPVAEQVAAYDDAYQHFHALYPAQKSVAV
jgi:xylulokinase